ncbi:type VI secretion system protein VasI [Tamilnaduibacter salinus]|uniref:Type VI secretion system protein VasI n=1 Tax=Tamilnaduibacter salinus TaxID=1484056 RepID=A0A2U1CZ20_9GAMM|nr:type VI secretion system-associated protein VasI [Tamilnaduibacter salinus]PVY77667.1 type VI secretion system protein VasI [Tamilnaduibacter salinus]
MRLFRWALVGLLVSPALAAPAPSTLEAARECTDIVERPGRLACFDAVFGTPVRTSAEETQPRRQPPIWIAARAQQTGRDVSEGAIHRRGDAGHLVTLAALGAQPPRPILVVQCDNNISRLALMMPAPLRADQVRLSLDSGDRVQRQVWRVRDDGFVVSAGRGLPAIDTIRTFLPASRLELKAGVAPVDGLVFDLQGLGDALAPLRRECGW